jgi:long-chain acyl-CoA synthetase
MEGETLVDLFHHLMQDDLHRPCLQARTQGRYQTISAQEVKEKVTALCKGLSTLDLQPGQKVAILCENRPEWLYIDFATLALGLVNVPIYTSNTPEQIRYILENSQSTALFVSSKFLEKTSHFTPALLPFLRYVIAIDDGDPKTTEEPLSSSSSLSKRLYSLSSFYQPQGVYEQKAISPETLCSIIYTSGSTGNPKGVLLSHRNIVSNLKAAYDLIQSLQLNPNELSEKGEPPRILSFLPLCHMFERLAGYYLMFFNKVCICYAESIEMVSWNLLEVRPTLMCSVPRLYEKMYATIHEKVESSSFLKKKLFHWACRIGKLSFEKTQKKQKLSLGLRLSKNLAQRLVFQKIKEKTGGRLRYFISGGAPLPPYLAEFFAAMDILILEGYGLTETSPIVTVNTPLEYRIGTVGKPLKGVEVRLAEDGEICVRGPNVMQGYYQNESATQEVIDSEGWFYTGDIGLWEDGFLKITDRKKDILVTSGGKNIAPQNLENLFKADPYFLEFVVVGDAHHYCCALVVPDFEKLKLWATEQGISETTPQELATNERVYAFFMDRIRSRSQTLSSFEQIKKIHLLPQGFSIESGELTPTLKIKRKVINEKYRTLIEAFYRE